MALKFNFKVGESEIHEIEFYFNQFWGNLYIKLDGKNIEKTIRFISLNLSKVYEFDLGEKEKHHIKIELIRKLLLAGFREYLGKVYADGNLLQEFRGNLSLKDLFFK
jgi:hypothetical protein